MKTALSRLITALLLALCLGAAHAQSGTPPLRNDSTIEVIYLGANDCPYCHHWEARAKGELLASPEGKAIRFVEVKGETLKRPILENDYPADHKWIFQRIGPSRGVPRFLLVIDGKITLDAYGTNRYTSVFLPAVRDAIARRAAAS